MTPLTKKVFELFGTPELAAELEQKQATGRLPAEAGTPRQVAPPDHRSLYGQMTHKIPADFSLVDAWLCDRHPALWRKIREIDDELTKLERQESPEAIYRAKLNELVTVCREVKALRMSEAAKVWMQ